MAVRFALLGLILCALTPAAGIGAETPGSAALSANGTWEADPFPAGTPGRSDHVAVYDPVRDRMLVFGGKSYSTPTSCCVRRGELFAMSLGEDPVWTELASTGPSPRRSPTMIYDPVRDRLILFGGVDDKYAGEQFIGTCFNDVWVMDLNGPPVWNLIVPNGIAPTPRFGHSAIYDPVRDRMLVFAGLGVNYYSDNGVWELSLSGTPTWTQLTTSGTPPTWRADHGGFYDPLRDGMLIVGGSRAAPYDEVWELSLGTSPTWTQLNTSQSLAAPHPLSDHDYAAIYDPRRDRIVVHGGTGSYSNQVHALSLHGAPVVRRWEPLVPEGGPTFSGSGHSAVYDPSRDQMVLFGNTGPSPLGATRLVWGQLVSVDNLLPRRALLHAPRPNPSLGDIDIQLDMPERSAATITVSDIQGRRVATLEQRTFEAGSHHVRWQGRDEGGASVTAGVYYVLAEGAGWREMRRIVLMR